MIFAKIKKHFTWIFCFMFSICFIVACSITSDVVDTSYLDLNESQHFVLFDSDTIENTNNQSRTDTIENTNNQSATDIETINGSTVSHNSWTIVDGKYRVYDKYNVTMMNYRTDIAGRGDYADTLADTLTEINKQHGKGSVPVGYKNLTTLLGERDLSWFAEFFARENNASSRAGAKGSKFIIRALR